MNKGTVSVLMGENAANPTSTMQKFVLSKPKGGLGMGMGAPKNASKMKLFLAGQQVDGKHSIDQIANPNVNYQCKTMSLRKSTEIKDVTLNLSKQFV